MSSDQGDYDKGGLIAFVFSMGFSILFITYLAFFHKGVDLKEIPTGSASGPTQTLATATSGTQDVDVSGITDPWVPNSKMVQHGHYVFKQNCVMCHGPQGLGNGPAAASLNPHPRNLVKGHWHSKGDSIALFKVLQHGIPGSAMPSWKQLPVKDRWALVQFIRSITHNKVPDNPEELAEFAKTAK